MTFADYFQETQGTDILFGFSIFGLNTFVTILYIFFMRRIRQVDFSVGKKVLDKLIWVGIGLAFSIPICSLVNVNNWMIEQSVEDFNGLEYFSFAGFFEIGSLLGFIAFDIVYYFYKKKKSK